VARALCERSAAQAVVGTSSPSRIVSPALAQARIDLKKAQDDRTRMVYRRASDATLSGLEADLIMAQEELDNAQDYYNHSGGARQ